MKDVWKLVHKAGGKGAAQAMAKEMRRAQRKQEAQLPFDPLPPTPPSFNFPYPSIFEEEPEEEPADYQDSWRGQRRGRGGRGRGRGRGEDPYQPRGGFHGGRGQSGEGRGKGRYRKPKAQADSRTPGPPNVHNEIERLNESVERLQKALIKVNERVVVLETESARAKGHTGGLPLPDPLPVTVTGKPSMVKAARNPNLTWVRSGGDRAPAHKRTAPGLGGILGSELASPSLPTSSSSSSSSSSSAMLSASSSSSSSSATATQSAMTAQVTAAPAPSLVQDDEQQEEKEEKEDEEEEDDNKDELEALAYYQEQLLKIQRGMALKKILRAKKRTRGDSELQDAQKRRASGPQTQGLCFPC